MAYLFLSCRRCRHSLRTSISPGESGKEKNKRAGETGQKQNKRHSQNERTNVRTNSFCTCSTFHCSAVGAGKLAVRGGRYEREYGRGAQGCHQWQQPSNVARKPTRCSIHFRFGLHFPKYLSPPYPLPPKTERTRGMIELPVNLSELRGI